MKNTWNHSNLEEVDIEHSTVQENVVSVSNRM